MTAQQQPGTAIAKRAEAEERLADKLLGHAQTPAERAAAFELLSRFRQSQMIRQAAAAIAEKSWGKECSPYVRAAIARYALETGTDPVRHWEVLGGHLYDTAQLWLDVATSQADYQGYEQDDLSWNEGLDDDEVARRRRERAAYGIPQDVKGACVVRIFRKGIRRPFIGANHAGHRQGFNAKLREHRGGPELIQDPIGEQDPGKTAFTRAFRRAAKTAWPLWPYKRLPQGDDGIQVQELPPGAVERREGHEAIGRQIAAEHEAAKGEPSAQEQRAYRPVDDAAGYGEAEARTRAEDQRLIDEGR